MADNILVDNGGETDYTVRASELSGGPKVQHFRQDFGAGSVEAPALTVRIDEGATYTYFGFAPPGTSEAASTWQIKRLTNSSGTVLWADGNASFDNVWNDRAGLTYS